MNGEAELTRLTAENAMLRERVTLLEDQVNFLGQHRTLSSGIAGERLVAQLSRGALTPHTSGHDVEVGLERVEVKFANLSRPVENAPTKRWQWQKIYGQTNNKNYTHLLLIGEADSRFRNYYSDPLPPFVLFLLPFDEARPLCVKGNPLGILLNSNPSSARGSSKKLFTHFQVTAQQIESRYSVAVTDVLGTAADPL